MLSDAFGIASASLVGVDAHGSLDGVDKLSISIRLISDSSHGNACDVLSSLITFAGVSGVPAVGVRSISLHCRNFSNPGVKNVSSVSRRTLRLSVGHAFGDESFTKNGHSGEKYTLRVRASCSSSDISIPGLREPLPEPRVDGNRFPPGEINGESSGRKAELASHLRYGIEIAEIHLIGQHNRYNRYERSLVPGGGDISRDARLDPKRDCLSCQLPRRRTRKSEPGLDISFAKKKKKTSNLYYRIFVGA